MHRTSVVHAVQNRLHRLLAMAAAMLTVPALAIVVGSTPNANACPYWGAQLHALKPDLIATLNG
jgi:hypothetical protein